MITDQIHWQQTNLGSISSDIAYGYTESSSSEKIGPKFLRITDIQNDFINWDTVPYCPISEENHKKYALEVGDVVIARTGNSTGATATIKKDIDAVFASYLIRFKIDPQKADYKFVNFLLRSNQWKSFVKSIKTGSAQGGANAKQFASFPIPLPPFPEQRAIATMLSSFDDKIELLQSQNQTLEAIAQALFKEWFVNFNFPNAEGKPYKKSGGKIVESELGAIPKDWEISKLKELIIIKRGGSPRPIQDFISEKGLRWLKISDASATVSPYIFKIKEHIKIEGLKKTVHLKAGSLVLSNSATPGIPKFLAVDSCIHDGWLFFPESKLSYNFLYLLFKEIKPKLIQQGSGSVFTNLKTDILKEYNFPIAQSGILKRFDKSIETVFNKIYNNAHQIQDLTILRDTIMPKLLNRDITTNY